MRTMPLSAQLAEKVVDFEAIVREATSNGRIDHAKAVRIIAAGRAMGRDAGRLSEAVDLCGALVHGTAGVDSPRVLRRIGEIRRRNVIDLHPEFDEAA